MKGLVWHRFVNKFWYSKNGRTHRDKNEKIKERNSFFSQSFRMKNIIGYQVRNIKWSGNFSKGALCENSQSLWQTHETQGPSTSITRSHMSQLLTAFPLRLSSAGPQKCDFCKVHSRREYKVVHLLLECESVTVRGSIPPLANFFFFSEIWLQLIDRENVLDCFFSQFLWFLLKMKKIQCTAVLQMSHLLCLSKFSRY